MWQNLRASDRIECCRILVTKLSLMATALESAPRNLWRKKKRILIIVVFDVFLFLGGYALFVPLREFYVPWAAQVAEVEEGRTRVREGPSSNYEILFKLPIEPKLGTALIVRQINDWYELETEDGVPCPNECTYSTKEKLDENCLNADASTTCRLEGMSRRDKMEPIATTDWERILSTLRYLFQNPHYLLIAFFLSYLPLLRSCFRSKVLNSPDTPLDEGVEDNPSSN